MAAEVVDFDCKMKNTGSTEFSEQSKLELRLIWAYPRKLLKSRVETERQLEGLKIKLLKCSLCMGSGQGRESMDKQQGGQMGRVGDGEVVEEEEEGVKLK